MLFIYDWKLENHFMAQTLASFTTDAASQGVKLNEAEFNRSKKYIQTQLKAYIAQYVWKRGHRDGLNNEFFEVMGEADNTYQKALTLFGRARLLEKGDYTTQTSKQ